MQHLRSLMDLKKPSFGKIHNFLFDRYRSVRQDLYVQGIEVRPDNAFPCTCMHLHALPICMQARWSGFLIDSLRLVEVQVDVRLCDEPVLCHNLCLTWGTFVPQNLRETCRSLCLNPGILRQFCSGLTCALRGVSRTTRQSACTRSTCVITCCVTTSCARKAPTWQTQTDSHRTSTRSSSTRWPPPHTPIPYPFQFYKFPAGPHPCVDIFLWGGSLVCPPFHSRCNSSQGKTFLRL